MPRPGVEPRGAAGELRDLHRRPVEEHESARIAGPADGGQVPAALRIPLEDVHVAAGKGFLEDRLDRLHFGHQPAGAAQPSIQADSGQPAGVSVVDQGPARAQRFGRLVDEIQARVLDGQIRPLPGHQVDAIDPVGVAADVGSVVKDSRVLVEAHGHGPFPEEIVRGDGESGRAGTQAGRGREIARPVVAGPAVEREPVGKPRVEGRRRADARAALAIEQGQPVRFEGEAAEGPQLAGRGVEPVEDDLGLPDGAHEHPARLDRIEIEDPRRERAARGAETGHRIDGVDVGGRQEAQDVAGVEEAAGGKRAAAPGGRARRLDRGGGAAAREARIIHRRAERIAIALRQVDGLAGDRLADVARRDQHARIRPVGVEGHDDAGHAAIGAHGHLAVRLDHDAVGRDPLQPVNAGRGRLVGGREPWGGPAVVAHQDVRARGLGAIGPDDDDKELRSLAPGVREVAPVGRERGDLGLGRTEEVDETHRRSRGLLLRTGERRRRQRDERGGKQRAGPAEHQDAPVAASAAGLPSGAGARPGTGRRFQ